MTTVEADTADVLQRWQPWLQRASYWPSAHNLAAYLALRRHDLRELQAELVRWGVSSLGRCEPHVQPNLQAAVAALAALDGERPVQSVYSQFAELSSRLTQHSAELLGQAQGGVMVTFPSEAATEPALVHDLLTAGMTVARINLAHDGPTEWEAMLHHLQMAREQTGRPCRALMDLGGPKVRTTEPQWPGEAARLKVGDELELGGDVASASGERPWVGCTLPAALAQVQEGQEVWFDDGKLGTVVVATQPGRLTLRVTQARAKGERLKAEKGINFPETALELPALTDQDRRDLHFAAQHADMIGYSFVQTPQDVLALLAALDAEGAPASLGIVLKIETRLAVRNFPELMVCAAGSRPCGVMIARGDLAVELGFSRMAELQEELLWLSEAAHLPVIWATQVLEALVEKGVPTRGEFTDAAGGCGPSASC
ncbi:pyruvate kinase [Deinococcus radiophilus]|uniref:pyruvate kinase n=1 Tax=Deinococcus radiophilus TaxID=32062 RepID=UPI0036180013